MKTRGTRAQPLYLALFVASSLAATPAAYAQTAKPKPEATAAADKKDKPLDKKALAEAKKHYGDGETKFKAGDYSGALAEFQAADAVKETPQAARYIGQCQDNLGHFPEAVTAYQRFLSNVPPKMAAQGEEIRQRVNAIQALPGKVHVTSDPAAAAFSIDGKVQPNPTPTDVDVAPGHHSLHFTTPGHDPVDKDIDVAYAVKQEVTVTLPASAAPPPPPPPIAVVPAPSTPVAASEPPPPAPPENHSKLPAFITGGLAVAAAGVGTAFGILALNDKSSFNSSPTTQTADNGENHALIADMAFGVAVTLGVTSAVLFLSGDDAPPAAAPATPAPAASREDGAYAKEARAKRRPAVTITPTPIVMAHGGGAGALIRF